MATFNASAEHSTATFVATPVQLDTNGTTNPFAAASHFITTSTPSAVLGNANGLHRQTTAVTSNSTSSSYTVLQIKREPCQVSEVTTSNNCQQLHHQQQQQQQQHHHHHHQQHHHGVCSATSSTSISATATGNTSKTVSASTLTTLVKIEPPSPKVSDLMDKSSLATFGGNTNNSVPIGIAVARKRQQETNAPTLANCNSTAIPLSQTLNKDLSCYGIRVADLGGVGTGCGNIFFTGNGDLMTGSAAATAEELALSAAGVQSVNRAPSTIWQYPSAALPFESVISMSPATVGLQYSREASRAAGQVVLLPAATAAALGISNIPPLCYTPTDPFQQAAAAAALVWPSAAYIPQGTGASTAATLQPPSNFLFPSMSSAHTAATAAATLQPQSYATAASLQLFGSSYLRNATEFMAAAGKTTTTTHQNHLIAATATPTATMSLPQSAVGATALSFETRDKTTMTTTTTTNLLELQSNAQALNLIRLPTPPTSATIGDGQHAMPPQILFQTSHATTAATASPTPALLNLSTTGPNATILPRGNPVTSGNYLTNATLTTTTTATGTGIGTGGTMPATIGPPTPVGDEHNATNVPLALNFKSAPVCDPANNSSLVVGVPRALTSVQSSSAATQPQMQDVNIQTDTPVCSEDENSSCPLALQQQQQQHQHQAASATSGCLTPPPYHSNTEGIYTQSDEANEPLELTKGRDRDEHDINSGFNEFEAEEHKLLRANMLCHNAKEEREKGKFLPPAENGCENNRVGNSNFHVVAATINENGQTYETSNEPPAAQTTISPQTTTAVVTGENACPATSTDDFTGLELLSNISTSTLATKTNTTAAAAATGASSAAPTSASGMILRVKQEPADAVDDFPQQQQPQAAMHAMPTIAAKLENPITTTATTFNGFFEKPPASATSIPTTDTAPPVVGMETTPTVAEPLGGLNLLCALAERIQEEEDGQAAGLFVPTSSTASQRGTPMLFQQQQQPPQQPPPSSTPFRLEPSSFPSMEGIELPTTSGMESATITPPPVPSSASTPTATIATPATPHVKRKKHKHSKSSKSAALAATSLINGATMSPNSLKSAKRCNKKNKKKYAKEKRRQQRAAAAELDFDDEHLREELQKALRVGNGSGSSSASGASGVSTHVKWPSPEEIFNIMETSMRQRLADINRRYRKKKRKLDEISKSQRKKKKCSKLIAQQLQQQLQLQQQQQQQQHQQQTLLPSSLTAATLSLNSSGTSGLSTTSPLGDYKFTTKFSTKCSAPSAATTTSPYLQPSSFQLRFPPLSASTADEDSDKNSKSKRNPIYKPVRLEPSALSAAIVANGASNASNGGSNSNSNSGTSNGLVDTYSMNAALRLAQKHASTESAALSVNNNPSSGKEPKLLTKVKTPRTQPVVVANGNMAGTTTKHNKLKLSKKVKSRPTSPQMAQKPQKPQRPRTQVDEELTLTNEHLYRKETRVLTDMGGLFYAGIMKPLQPPDIYAITLDGERGNKPHIMSREEIFKDTILEISPKSVDSVPVGTRLCAYWSQQYRCLYPGRAIESESSEGDETSTEKDFVSVEFDDGDSGRIRLQNIRFLLSDYPIVEYNDNPLYSLGKQKKSVTALKNGGGGSGGVGGGQHVPPTLDTNSIPQPVEATTVAVSLCPSVLPSILGNGITNGADTEMYARRTGKKRLKKNPKKKTQSTNPTNATNGSSNDGELANTMPADDNDYNRKHHKHKKHKKHKKHHRRASIMEGEAIAIPTRTATPTAAGNGNGNDFEIQSTPAVVQDLEGSPEKRQRTELVSAPAVSHKPIKLEANTAVADVKVKRERVEEIEEESTSNLMSENSDEVKGDDDDDEIEHNNSKGSKIAAFLPERQLWGWLGTAYRKAGVKGRARKQFYKTIKRGKELITVGDCAVFLSTGRPDRPYIGRIESMWETASSNKVVRVRWFYHPEETVGCPNLKYPGALFESPHEDENDVQTISHRCEVLPFERYFEKFGADTKQYQSIYDNNDTYYLAGYYNPRAQTLILQENIPTTAIVAKASNNDKVDKGVKIDKKNTNTSTSTSTTSIQ